MRRFRWEFLGNGSGAREKTEAKNDPRRIPGKKWIFKVGWPRPPSRLRFPVNSQFVCFSARGTERVFLIVNNAADSKCLLLSIFIPLLPPDRFAGHLSTRFESDAGGRGGGVNAIRPGFYLDASSDGPTQLTKSVIVWESSAEEGMTDNDILRCRTINLPMIDNSGGIKDTRWNFHSPERVLTWISKGETCRGIDDRDRVGQSSFSGCSDSFDGAPFVTPESVRRPPRSRFRDESSGEREPQFGRESFSVGEATGPDRSGTRPGVPRTPKRMGLRISAALLLVRPS